MNWNKLIICILAVLTLSGCGIKTKIKRADRKFAIGEYYDAADVYRQIYPRLGKKDKEVKARVAFNQAECYRILNNARAINSYQNAIRYHYPDSITYLRLAQCQQYQGKYREAEKNYRLYLQTYPTDYVAQAGLYACMQVGDWKKSPSRYKVTLAKEFNAKKSSNYAPAYIGEETDAIMFTSNREASKSSSNVKTRRDSPVTGQQTGNLFSTRKNANGQWEDIALAEGLYGDADEDEDVNEDQNENQNDSVGGKTGKPELGVCSFTGDGKTMYFTYSQPKNGQDQGAKIYVSARAGGEWGEPREVKLFNDSSITVGHPAINSVGDTLYFASDAPGGWGGKDIWMAVKEGEEWLAPVNLGSSINTSCDEMFPALHPNGTLYFSSNGHPGYGGLDIFQAIPSADKDSNDMPVSWELFNMATPLNSNGDDFGITFSSKAAEGYFSSNRGQKRGYDLIYHFVLPEMVFMVEGMVSDNAGDPIIDGTLRLVGTDGTNQKVQIRRDGTYSLRINRDAKYAMLATCRGYLNEKQQLETFGLTDSKTYHQNFILSPISKPIKMDNIFYEFGKWDLTQESEVGLQQLVKLLNDNPNITIELSAHTDLKGDSVFNMRLSEKRAQSVVTYLINAGIEKERLTPVGYGKTKPVVVDKTLHKQYSFLPINQTLDATYILSLSEEQQEICNAINRRTEFKVLKTTYKLY